MVDHVPEPWGLWNNYNWERPWLNVWKNSLGYFWFLGCMWSRDDIQNPGATHPGQTTGDFPLLHRASLGLFLMWFPPLCGLLPWHRCSPRPAVLAPSKGTSVQKLAFCKLHLTYFINWKIKHLPGRKRPYNLKSWKTDHYSERIHLLNRFVSCTLVYPQKHSWPFTTSGLAEAHTKGLILCDAEHP